MDEAACKTADPSLFFPERTHDVSQAKIICERCPVQGDCLEHSIENNEQYGVWGGMSERQRRKIILDRGFRQGRRMAS